MRGLRVVQQGASALLAAAVRSQQWLCHCVDRFLPAELRVDGHRNFMSSSVLPHVHPGMLIYDVGAGRRPFFSPRQKQELRLRVCGLDISQAELDAAPAGSYDTVVCADITQFRGHTDADLVICQAVLEHVPDTARAMRAIASILKSGGKALIFVPCRNAMFARLNLLLPQELKRKLLFALLPHTRSIHGFRSYYDRCTPAGLRAMSTREGLSCEELKCYYMSAYLSVFFPCHVLWRLWVLLARAICGPQMCETFSVTLRKQGSLLGPKPEASVGQPLDAVFDLANT